MKVQNQKKSVLQNKKKQTLFIPLKSEAEKIIAMAGKRSSCCT